jgi:type I site-specific restriction-modification system R (restriction) subunit
MVKNTIGNASNAEKYERDIIEDLETMKVEILIVVDKLLTGLTTEKHGFVHRQAPEGTQPAPGIARVNRLHEAKIKAYSSITGASSNSSTRP